MKIETIYDALNGDAKDATDWPYEWLKAAVQSNTILRLDFLRFWDREEIMFSTLSQSTYVNRFAGVYDMASIITDPQGNCIEITDDKGTEHTIPYKKGDIIYYHHHHDGTHCSVLRMDKRPCQHYTAERFIKHFTDAKVMDIGWKW